jgi:hypothetical protein
MKELNSDDIFKIFSVGDQEVYKENGVEEILDDSFVLFGTVIKGVENYFIIDQLYAHRYGNQYFSAKENIKLKYFTGLVRHLQRIEEIQSSTVAALEDEFGLQAINYALQEMLLFFEEVECYEYCAEIYKYIELFSLKELVVR